MYYNPYYYPAYPTITHFPVLPMNYQIPRTYPSVNTQIFSQSIKSFRLLMAQGSILLDRLSNVQFARQLMTAAQKGNQGEVDRLIKSLGLKVPVITKYTPSGVNFELVTPTSPNNPTNCCTLTINMKWGSF